MTVTNINPEKEPIPRSWVPTVITGGKEPPSEGECWIERLAIGTVFVCNYATSAWADCYELIWKGYKFYLLQRRGEDGTTRDVYIVPHRWCNERPEYEILGIETRTPTKGDDDEQGNRSD